MERNNLPVRIIILKARQMGFSTLVQALIYERLQRLKNRRGLIIAHRKDTTKLLLKMMHTMRDNLKRSRDKTWNLKWDSKSTYYLRWSWPFKNDIEVTSAEVPEPGHGDTAQYVHMSETSRWPDAGNKVKGILAILPKRPGTMGFNESTANGDTGYFRDAFWKAWKERDLPLLSERRVSSWRSMFYPWYEHEGYRWTATYGVGRELSDEMVANLEDTMDDEERALLKVRYFRRGHGPGQKVDYDQLLWRRTTIVSEVDTLADFHEQYPAYPHEAFQSSGRPAYNAETLRAMSQAAETDPPIWRGEIVEAKVA